MAQGAHSPVPSAAAGQAAAAPGAAGRIISNTIDDYQTHSLLAPACEGVGLRAGASVLAASTKAPSHGRYPPRRQGWARVLGRPLPLKGPPPGWLHRRDGRHSRILTARVPSSRRVPIPGVSLGGPWFQGGISCASTIMLAGPTFKLFSLSGNSRWFLPQTQNLNYILMKHWARNIIRHQCLRNRCNRHKRNPFTTTEVVGPALDSALPPDSK